MGVRLLAGLPLEELLFFLVVPFAAILGFEAVRAVRGSAAPAGDEVPDAPFVDAARDQATPGGRATRAWGVADGAGAAGAASAVGAP